MKRLAPLTLSAALLAGFSSLAPGRDGTQAVLPDDATPVAPLRAWAWSCDDGSMAVTRLAADPPAVLLRLDGRAHRLPQRVAASGVRYEDDTLQWWEKGAQAMLQRKPAAPLLTCREDRAQSLLEDARARGVSFRAVGNEPGWLLEIGPLQRVRLDYAYGTLKLVFDELVPRADAATGQALYEGRADGHRVRFTIADQPCQDDMSGQPFPAAVQLEVDGSALRGCGQPLGR
jgi:putative lipoprotein